MKKMTAVLLIAVLALSMLAMAGCSVEQKNPTNLEEYVEANESMKEQIEGIAEGYDALEISIDKNTITYKYTYEQTLKDEEIEANRENIEKNLASQEASFNEVASSLEEETGLTDIRVTLLYVDGDGKEIYTITYPTE